MKKLGRTKFYKVENVPLQQELLFSPQPFAFEYAARARSKTKRIVVLFAISTFAALAIIPMSKISKTANPKFIFTFLHFSLSICLIFYYATITAIVNYPIKHYN